MRSTRERLKDCEHVNKILFEDAKKRGLGTKQSLKRLREARQVDNILFYELGLKEFQEYVRRILDKHPVASAAYLIKNGAYLLGISLDTAKRYLAVLRADDAPFSGGYGDMVAINPDYTDASDYWQDADTTNQEG